MGENKDNFTKKKQLKRQHSFLFLQSGCYDDNKWLNANCMSNPATIQKRTINASVELVDTN